MDEEKLKIGSFGDEDAEPEPVGEGDDAKKLATEGGKPATSEEESKVPYSRFKKFHEGYKEAKQEAAEWRAKAEELERSREVREEPRRQTQEAPGWWTKLYGDNAASKEAWVIYQENAQSPTLSKEEIRREAIEAYRTEQRQETARVNANLEMIDDSLLDLSAQVGREITPQEQSDLLDIVDEFTPKDEEGNYIGAIVPFEKAWEVYEMRHQSRTSSQRKSRDAVASLTGSSGRGEPASAQAEEDKNFVPGRWDSWRSKLAGK